MRIAVTMLLALVACDQIDNLRAGAPDPASSPATRTKPPSTSPAASATTQIDPPLAPCVQANEGRSAGVCANGQRCTCRHIGGALSSASCACEKPAAPGTCGDTGETCTGGTKCCRQAHSGAPFYCAKPNDDLICD